MSFCMTSALRGSMVSFLIVSTWCWFVRDQSGKLWCMAAIFACVMSVIWVYLESREVKR